MINRINMSGSQIFLSATATDNHFRYNDYNENPNSHTKLEKNTDDITEEFDKVQKEYLESQGQQYKNKKLDMKEAGVALSLADDLADAKKNRLAGFIYRNVRQAVQNSENFSDLKVFDGTEQNSSLSDLENKVQPENAQKYYESEDGKKALAEIGADNVKTENGKTTATINGKECTLEMNENGTLRFSYIQENDAIHAWEYDLKTKPEIPVEIIQDVPEISEIQKTEEVKPINRVNMNAINDPDYNPQVGSALANAAHIVQGTCGYCLSGVADSFDRIWPGEFPCIQSAWEAADYLASDYGVGSHFKETKCSREELNNLKAGTVVVWHHNQNGGGWNVTNAGRIHGHISIALGDGQESSDHIQEQITGRDASYRVFIPV